MAGRAGAKTFYAENCKLCDPQSPHNSDNVAKYWIAKCVKVKKISRISATEEYHAFRKSITRPKGSTFLQHHPVTGIRLPKPVYYLLNNQKSTSHAQNLAKAVSTGKQQVFGSSFVPTDPTHTIRSFYIAHDERTSDDCYNNYLSNLDFIELRKMAHEYFKEHVDKETPAKNKQVFVNIMSSNDMCAPPHLDMETNVGSVVIILEQSHQEETFRVFSRNGEQSEFKTNVGDMIFLCKNTKHEVPCLPYELDKRPNRGRRRVSLVIWF